MDNNNHQNVNSKLGLTLAKGENVVKEVSKHPIGALFSALIGGAVALSVILGSVIVFGLIRSSETSDAANYASLMIVVGFVLAILVIIATLVNIYLYRQNRLIVTTEKVAQIEYRTIIDRKVVQLSIERVQDVTVSQVGIFPRLFKYGTIIVDTAGEQEDCVFSFTPNPYEISREIMNLHETATARYKSVV